MHIAELNRIRCEVERSIPSLSIWKCALQPDLESDSSDSSFLEWSKHPYQHASSGSCVPVTQNDPGPLQNTLPSGISPKPMADLCLL